MKIEVNIGKKYFLSILAALLLIAGIFIVSSYINPSTGVGHELSDVGGNPNCGPGQAITHNQSGWYCLDLQKIKTGTYLGSGSAQTITVGFTPRYLIITSQDMGASESTLVCLYSTVRGNAMTCRPTNQGALDHGAVVIYVQNGFQFVSGFSTNNDGNKDGENYSYVAFG